MTTVQLDPASAAALEAKIASRIQLSAMRAATPPLATAREFALWFPDYGTTPAGRYLGLESIRLRWVKPDWFEFFPQPNSFAFKRANGEVITPRRMFTDGGSIPHLAQVLAEFSPWGYAPAYLVHDWEFDAHHSGSSAKSFEAVRDTLVEGLKTLMESGLCPKSRGAFFAVAEAVNSDVARQYWNANTGNLLPPAPLG